MTKPQYTRVKFDLGKLQDPLVDEQFKATIGGRFGPLLLLDDNSDIERDIELFEQVTTEAATEILGKKRTKKKPWVTSELFDLCDKRRELKAKKKSCPQAKKDYSSMNKTVKKEMIKAKEKWVQEQCEDIESNLTRNNSKKAYETIKTLTKAKLNKVNTIKDKDGETIMEKTKILERWTEYCTELYNYELKGDASVLLTPTSQNDDSDNFILKSEIEEAVKMLKKGKSPGVDNIPGELIQAGG